MTRGLRALGAAAAVEAASGFAAATLANGLGGGRQPVAIFMAGTLAAVMADMVLIPGCVWVVRPRMPWHLLLRTIAAVITLVAAIWTAAWVTAGVIVLASIVFHGASQNELTGASLLCVPFLVGGAIVGLGAAAADWAVWRPGAAKARWTSHVLGGLAGMVLMLGIALLPTFGDATASPADVWWPLLVLVPAVLVLGGGTRNALMARDAARSGTALTDAGPVARRAAACCALLLIVAVAAQWSR